MAQIQHIISVSGRILLVETFPVSLTIGKIKRAFCIMSDSLSLHCWYSLFPKQWEGCLSLKSPSFWKKGESKLLWELGQVTRKWQDSVDDTIFSLHQSLRYIANVLLQWKQYYILYSNPFLNQPVSYTWNYCCIAFLSWMFYVAFLKVLTLLGFSLYLLNAHALRCNYVYSAP